MADPHSLDFMRLPIDTLIALDWRPYHFFLQRYITLCVLRTSYL